MFATPYNSRQEMIQTLEMVYIQKETWLLANTTKKTFMKELTALIWTLKAPSWHFRLKGQVHSQWLIVVSSVACCLSQIQ